MAEADCALVRRRGVGDTAVVGWCCDDGDDVREVVWCAGDDGRSVGPGEADCRV